MILSCHDKIRPIWVDLCDGVNNYHGHNDLDEYDNDSDNGDDFEDDDLCENRENRCGLKNTEHQYIIDALA